jgi:hypothetical protein
LLLGLRIRIAATTQMQARSLFLEQLAQTTMKMSIR